MAMVFTEVAAGSAGTAHGLRTLAAVVPVLLEGRMGIPGLDGKAAALEIVFFGGFPGNDAEHTDLFGTGARSQHGTERRLSFLSDASPADLVAEIVVEIRAAPVGGWWQLQGGVVEREFGAVERIRIGGDQHLEQVPVVGVRRRIKGGRTGRRERGQRCDI